MFQSPRGDFGFLKIILYCLTMCVLQFFWFQSPRGDFGFLKGGTVCRSNGEQTDIVSIPSRGFWFFEGGVVSERGER